MLALSACGSDDSPSGGTGGTGGANSCQTACQKVVNANCGDVAASACASSCGPVASCASELESYYSCISSKATVTCDATTSLVAGCDAEDKGLNVCSVCQPAAGDDACDTCTETSCCTQLKAYVSASDVESFYACISAPTCTTQACVDTCVSTFPVAGKAYGAAITCQGTSCVKGCVCAAFADDSPCVSCVKAGCCDLFARLSTASDNVAFNTCLGACANTDVACFDDCVAKSPVSGAAYNALDSSCLQTTCATACGA
jgi:hypothetical protein